MPGPRALLSSLTAAILVGLTVDLWMHWPDFLAVGIGALFGVASLIATSSVQAGGAAADAAWRAAAPDLDARATSELDPDRDRHPPMDTPSRS